MRAAAKHSWRGLSALALLLTATIFNPASAAAAPTVFTMVPSGGPKGCLPYAKAVVTITSLGPVELMTVVATGLPRNTEFDLFNIQVPNFPFGLSWYLGDMRTNSYGRASGRFIGRFNRETFIVAPGSAPAPKLHPTDAIRNPVTPPVHILHLGLWFNSPKDADEAGCGDAVTPFNGDHTAGVQALNTSNAPDTRGPLIRVAP